MVTAALSLLTARRSCRSAVALACRRRVSFSSSSSAITSNNDTSAESTTAPISKQPFVHAHLRPGEWDPNRLNKNPLYRPVYKSRAKILSKDDFLKEPKVGLSADYTSFTAAGLTLTWMVQEDHQQIYRLYTDLLVQAHTKHAGRTSHEYIMRVIAQKFNITPLRAGAIVQLQHNEEQMKRQHPERLLYESADYMDHAIKEEIREAYKTWNEKPPEDSFVEDPVFVSGMKERKAFEVLGDLLDVDQIMEDTIVREEREARLLIDGHVYVEDINDETIPVPLTNTDCKKLLAAHAKFQTTHPETGVASSSSSSSSSSTTTAAAAPPIEWPKGPGRPRWKYIAQLVNTRELKRKKCQAVLTSRAARKTSTGFTNNCPDNTLVEHAGTLTPGNMAHVRNLSWKLVQYTPEHTYKFAKQGWMKRQNEGDDTAWGYAPPRSKRQAVDNIVAAPEKEESMMDDDAVQAKDDGGGGDDEAISPDETISTDEAIITGNVVSEMDDASPDSSDDDSSDEEVADGVDDSDDDSDDDDDKPTKK